jgi:hypothetical protein
LLIQLQKLFSVVGVGLLLLAGPLAWFHNVRYELIYCSQVLQTDL